MGRGSHRLSQSDQFAVLLTLASGSVNLVVPTVRHELRDVTSLPDHPAILENRLILLILSPLAPLLQEPF